MHPLAYVALALFAAVMASDWWLVRKVRKALEVQRLDASDLNGLRSAGSPLGIVVNLFRVRKLPAINRLPDAERTALVWQYRAHLVLVGLLAVCIVALFALRAAA
jgi:hypothetical protein